MDALGLPPADRRPLLRHRPAGRQLVRRPLRAAQDRGVRVCARRARRPARLERLQLPLRRHAAREPVRRVPDDGAGRGLGRADVHAALDRASRCPRTAASGPRRSTGPASAWSSTARCRSSGRSREVAERAARARTSVRDSGRARRLRRSRRAALGPRRAAPRSPSRAAPRRPTAVAPAASGSSSRPRARSRASSSTSTAGAQTCPSTGIRRGSSTCWRAAAPSSSPSTRTASTTPSWSRPTTCAKTSGSASGRSATSTCRSSRRDSRSAPAWRSCTRRAPSAWSVPAPRAVYSIFPVDPLAIDPSLDVSGLRRHSHPAARRRPRRGRRPRAAATRSGRCSRPCRRARRSTA